MGEEEEMRRSRKLARTHGGSRPGKARNLRGDFEGAHKMVLKHYFNGTVSPKNSSSSLSREEQTPDESGCVPRVEEIEEMASAGACILPRKKKMRGEDREKGEMEETA